jgi:hypothetical protein
VRLELQSTEFDPRDDRWQRRIDGLLADLRYTAPSVRRVHDSALDDHAKGALESILVALGSAGVIGGVFDVLKAWVARDRSRTVKVSWYEDGVLKDVELSGSGLDDEVVDLALQALTRLLAEVD